MSSTTMRMADFVRLKKLLTMATSDNDHEALQSWRRATELIRAYGFTWEMVLDKRVPVLAAVEYAEEGETTIDNPPEDKLEEADFELALCGVGGDFRATLLSIQAQWEEGKYLSPKQIKVVRNAAERNAARHPGGRFR